MHILTLLLFFTLVCGWNFSLAELCIMLHNALIIMCTCVMSYSVVSKLPIEWWSISDVYCLFVASMVSEDTCWPRPLFVHVFLVGRDRRVERCHQCRTVTCCRQWGSSQQKFFSYEVPLDQSVSQSFRGRSRHGQTGWQPHWLNVGAGHGCEKQPSSDTGASYHLNP